MRYTIHVIETRTQPVTYEIEAESLEAAIDQAVTGDTESEEETGSYEVADRVVVSWKRVAVESGRAVPMGT
jgi:hypothetical protein